MNLLQQVDFSLGKIEEKIPGILERYKVDLKGAEGFFEEDNFSKLSNSQKIQKVQSLYNVLIAKVKTLNSQHFVRKSEKEKLNNILNKRKIEILASKAEDDKIMGDLKSKLGRLEEERAKILNGTNFEEQEELYKFREEEIKQMKTKVKSQNEENELILDNNIELLQQKFCSVQAKFRVLQQRKAHLFEQLTKIGQEAKEIEVDAAQKQQDLDQKRATLDQLKLNKADLDNKVKQVTSQINARVNLHKKKTEEMESLEKLISLKMGEETKLDLELEKLRKENSLLELELRNANNQNRNPLTSDSITSSFGDAKNKLRKNSGDTEDNFISDKLKSLDTRLKLLVKTLMDNSIDFKPLDT